MSSSLELSPKLPMKGEILVLYCDLKVDWPFAVD